MPHATRVAALAAAAVLLVGGGTAGALALTGDNPDTATCTSSPTVTRTGTGAEFDVHCAVPNTEVTTTVPGPTQTVTATAIVTATVTASPSPTPTPSPSSTPTAATHTLYGSSVPNPGGSSATAATTVTTKLGPRASIRLFHPASSTLTWTAPPAGATILQSFKPPTTITDAQIDALLNAAHGQYVAFWHESDNDGLTGIALTARIDLMNRLYDRNVALGHPATVVAIFTGGFFANYGPQSTRDTWAAVHGDLVGLDADGVHDSTGPTYDMTYADETANVMSWLKANPEYRGWAIPEFGTSRQAFDPDGTIRRDWMRTQVGIFEAAAIPPALVDFYDYDTSAHNGATTNYNRLADPSPELTYWRSLVAGN